MNWINKNIQLINTILLISIMIYNVFLDYIDFNFDFILIGIFIIVNIKNLVIFFKTKKILFAFFLIFILLNILQLFLLNGFSFNPIISIYNLRFLIIVITPLIMFFMISEFKFDKKSFLLIEKTLIIILVIAIVYGFINYILNFNLSSAGMHVLNNKTGRIQSFFTNPNGYALFLLFNFIYFLFNKRINKYLKWTLVAFIFVSICLTYGRFIYFLTAIIILIFIIYSLFLKGKKEKIYNIIIIICLVFSSFYLPYNNYLYLSLTYQFDSKFNTNITDPIYDVVDAIVITEDLTSNDILLNKIGSNEEQDYSSSSTRTTFKTYALKIYDENKAIGCGYFNYHKIMNEKFLTDGITYMTAGLPHNFYILLLSTTGLIGFISFLTILIIIFRYIYKSTNSKIASILLFAILLISNFEGDFMFGAYFQYILIALSMKIYYNNNCNKKIKEK